MRIVFGAGGTGGHITPALAVANELRDRGFSICFIGNQNSLEQKLCKAAGYPIRYIRVQKLYRKLTLVHLMFPVYLAISVIKAIMYIRNFKADLVFCTGGFVSGPVAIAAIICKVPLFFHESNSYPGLTTRLLSRYTSIVFTAFDASKRHLSVDRVLHVGIPIMDNVCKTSEFHAESYNLSKDSPKILVVGGSQGSVAINRVIEDSSSKLLSMGFELIWQTGVNSFDEYSAKFKGVKGIYIFDFSTTLPAFYQNSYIAITRAGAMTIAELEATKLPAILVPLETSAENHQYYNAIEQKKKGVADHILQKDLNVDNLISRIEYISDNYSQIKKKLEALPVNNAVNSIADYMCKYIGFGETEG